MKIPLMDVIRIIEKWGWMTGEACTGETRPLKMTPREATVFLILPDWWM
jgi:hypothetical protein